MNGQRHLTHVDRLRIEKDRSSEKHKARAIIRAIDENFFAGVIAWTFDSSPSDGYDIHVLEDKSHRNAVKGIRQTAKARFDCQTEIVDKDGYKTVVRLFL